MNNVSYKRRMIAYFIDISISFIAAFTILALLDVDLSVGYLKFFSLSFHFGQLILLVYLFLSYVFFGGTSIGRAIVNTRIVKVDGNRMGVFTILVRSLMQSILFIILLNIPYQLYFKTPTSIYDYITNTHTVFIRQRNN